jgi:curved DNA-binding protein CbpA
MASSSFKDYYAILNIPYTSDAEAIKAAYRTLAKKYHPDVNTLDTKANDGNKFREISEAYAILSVRETRLQYDERRVKELNPKLPQSQANIIKGERDKTGHVYQKPKEGSFASIRLKELQNEREKYNVNYYGFYQGGVPVEDNGSIRGKADKEPYYPHDPHTHNIDNNSIETFTQVVDAREAAYTNEYFHADRPNSHEASWRVLERDSHHRIRRKRLSTNYFALSILICICFYMAFKNYSRYKDKIFRRLVLPQQNVGDYLIRFGVVMKKASSAN